MHEFSRTADWEPLAVFQLIQHLIVVIAGPTHTVSGSGACSPSRVPKVVVFLLGRFSRYIVMISAL